MTKDGKNSFGMIYPNKMDEIKQKTVFEITKKESERKKFQILLKKYIMGLNQGNKDISSTI